MMMKTFPRRRWYWLGGLCLVIAFSAGFAFAQAGDQKAEAEAEAGVRKLVEDQLALAERALGLISRSARIGAPVSNAATDVQAWSYRRLGARLFLSFGADEPKTMDPEVYLIQAKGPPNPDRLAAFEEHRDLMKNWEVRFATLAKTGVGSQFNFLTFQAHLLQAEIWLARERDRKPGQAKF
jgi:hypothetical protein